MKTVLKIIVICCALIGVSLSAALILDYRNNQNMARKYLENCHQIKIGMSLNEARIILGEFDDDYFFIYKKQPEFEVVFADLLSRQYFLSYPYLEDEGNVVLQFDPLTYTIVNARCGGPY